MLHERIGLSAPTTITVLHSMPAPSNDGTTYFDQMREGAPAEVITVPFTWKAALFEKYDIFHLHWPEYLFRSTKASKKAAKYLACLLLMIKIFVLRIPVVRTVHNIDPHEPGNRTERAALALIERSVRAYIRLNPETPIQSTQPVYTIPHGHYRRLVNLASAELPMRKPKGSRVLYFGLIRPYKGIEPLLDAFSGLQDEYSELRIVGYAQDEELKKLIESRCADNPQISARLEYVSDRELVDEIRAADLTVLPYRKMHNSGALFMALSLDCPCLVPDNPTNRTIRDEVGTSWMILYSGEVSSRDLAIGIESARKIPVGVRPFLDNRDWRQIGQEIFGVYMETLSRRGRVLGLGGGR